MAASAFSDETVELARCGQIDSGAAETARNEFANLCCWSKQQEEQKRKDIGRSFGLVAQVSRSSRAKGWLILLWIF